MPWFYGLLFVVIEFEGVALLGLFVVGFVVFKFTDMFVVVFVVFVVLVVFVEFVVFGVVFEIFTHAPFAHIWPAKQLALFKHTNAPDGAPP